MSTPVLPTINGINFETRSTALVSSGFGFGQEFSFQCIPTKNQSAISRRLREEEGRVFLIRSWSEMNLHCSIRAIDSGHPLFVYRAQAISFA